jgi:signal transduction histidine kinase/ActR/RegA family two-component response regulator
MRDASPALDDTRSETGRLRESVGELGPTAVHARPRDQRPEEVGDAVAQTLSFLVSLNDALRPLRDAVEIQRAAARILGDRLRADWAYCCEFDPNFEYATIQVDHTRGDAPSMAGRHPLTEYFAGLAQLQSGQTVTFEDLQTSTRTTEKGRQQYAGIGLRGCAAVPILRDGRLVADLCVAFRAPHAFTRHEIGLMQEMAEQTWGAIERARSDAALAAELADTRLLQALSAELVAEEDASALHEKIVDAALSIVRADFASFQIFDADRPPNGELQLIALRGFSADAARRWEWIGVDARTPCGEALRTGARVIIPDIEQAAFMAGSDDQACLLNAGARSGQTTRLVSRAGKTVGMISTYWRDKHTPSERDLRLLDLLARQAADLTERSQSAEVLRRSEHQLKESDARKEEFLATLAHELRNPLAPIRNAVTFLNLTARDTETQWARDMILQQTIQLTRLVDDLLDVSRINFGRLELHKQRVDALNVLRSAIEASQPLIQDGGHRLTVTMPPDAVMVDADPTRLAQVFSNLLNNAAKFSNAGGAIAVSVEFGAHEVRVRVRDEGVGIDALNLPRVFDLFSQFHTSFERDRGGLGIGLALVKRLVELHGGDVTAASEGLERGSEFTVHLPRAVSPTESPPANVDALRRTPATLRVLVVDDHESGARSMARLLRHLGYETRQASDGQEGFNIAAEFHPDAALLDIGMPRINGYELARRIRAETWGRNMLLIAVTGWGQPGDKQRCSEAGFDHHLTKPVDVTEITRLLSSVPTSVG